MSVQVRRNLVTPEFFFLISTSRQQWCETINSDSQSLSRTLKEYSMGQFGGQYTSGVYHIPGSHSSSLLAPWETVSKPFLMALQTAAASDKIKNEAAFWVCDWGGKALLFKALSPWQQPTRSYITVSFFSSALSGPEWLQQAKWAGESSRDHFKRLTRELHVSKPRTSSKRFHILNFLQGLHTLPHQVVKMIRAVCNDQPFYCMSLYLEENSIQSNCGYQFQSWWLLNPQFPCILN